MQRKTVSGNNSIFYSLMSRERCQTNMAVRRQ